MKDHMELLFRKFCAHEKKPAYHFHDHLCIHCPARDDHLPEAFGNLRYRFILSGRAGLVCDRKTVSDPAESRKN